jgi:hypothetical protein
MDAVIADDLGRAHGTVLDAQIVNGSGSGQNLRGFLNVAGILSVAGTITSAATFIESVWKAYSALSGGSGYGTANPDEYVVILHPRRYAWVKGNATGIPAQALFPRHRRPLGRRPHEPRRRHERGRSPGGRKVGRRPRR